MSDTTKRLDLQFGSFACSVQGFDNPVQPVQQVLQALQNLLEETPELSDSGIAFDAETIERLVGEVARRTDLDEEKIEIVPGLIIVHRGDDGAAAGIGDAKIDVGEADDAGGDDRESEGWAQDYVAGVADRGASFSAMTKELAEPEEPVAAEPEYVNIFMPAASSGSGAGAAGAAGLFAPAAPAGPAPVWDQTPDADESFADRIERVTGAQGDVAVSANSRAGDAGGGREGEEWVLSGGDPATELDREPAPDPPANRGDLGGGVFTDPAGDGGDAPPGRDAAPVNFFAAPGSAQPDTYQDAGALGAIENVFTGAAQDEAGEDSALQDWAPARVETLFGAAEDQPDAEDAEDGYTAAGLASAAEAKTVADLIVSAAAWLVLIKGLTNFSRNDVIGVFQDMPGEHAKTLEARVKGFGAAVRNGHLVLVEDNVYGLSRTELERFQRLL